MKYLKVEKIVPAFLFVTAKLSREFTPLSFQEKKIISFKDFSVAIVNNRFPQRALILFRSYVELLTFQYFWELSYLLGFLCLNRIRKLLFLFLSAADMNLICPLSLLLLLLPPPLGIVLAAAAAAAAAFPCWPVKFCGILSFHVSPQRSLIDRKKTTTSFTINSRGDNFGWMVFVSSSFFSHSLARVCFSWTKKKKQKT